MVLDGRTIIKHMALPIRALAKLRRIGKTGRLPVGHISFIQQSSILRRIQQVQLAPGLLRTQVAIVIDRNFAGSPFFGGNNDNAIGGPGP